MVIGLKAPGFTHWVPKNKQIARRPWLSRESIWCGNKKRKAKMLATILESAKLALGSGLRPFQNTVCTIRISAVIFKAFWVETSVLRRASRCERKSCGCLCMM